MRRWRPSKSSAREYAELQEKIRDQFTFIQTDYPIRKGCWVKWVNHTDGVVLSGYVNKSTYRSDGQHSFSIRLDDGGFKTVMGRNLYQYLLEHKPGEIAKDPKHPLNNRSR